MSETNEVEVPVTSSDNRGEFAKEARQMIIKKRKCMGSGNRFGRYYNSDNVISKPIAMKKDKIRF